MENQQMAMPAEMAAAGPNPDEMAIYEQMRQGISPQEFSNEMLASASQIDPQAVAEFTQELQGLDMPPEVLDALNDVVDEILASPERYAELRAQYMEQGLPEDILPEQFDPQFFTALNMAIDQMIAAPTGVQAFAQGGIAELKPIAKAIASYGRNGDTMLAHITPAEARMLRRRGGSGTINPDTGLPEFFIEKLWKAVTKPLRAVGKAVKKFANSTVGRLVATVALGFFLGPAAASFMGVTSAAGVAAVSGFVGSAGSTLLGGGNLKDALKAGAIGGLTAGAGAGIMGGADAFAAGSYTGPTTVGGQFDKFKSAITPNAAPTGNLAPVVDAPVPVSGTGPQGVGPNQMPVPDVPDSLAYNLNMQAQQAAANAPAALPGSSAVYDPATATRAVDYGYTPGGTGNVPAYKPGGPTIGESFSKMGEGLGMGSEPASFKTFTEGATDLFSPGPTKAQLNIKVQEIMGANPGISAKDAMTLAKEIAPSALRTYAPAAVAGIGAMSAFGGFDTKPVEGGPITQSLMKPVTQRIREGGTQRQMYMQGLPGVVYDDFGAPVYGQSTRLPTYDVPDYNSGGFGSPGQGVMNLPSVYVPPSGTIGSRRVEQPYNNANMYSNIMPRNFADGGYAEGGTVTDLYRTVLRRDPSPTEIDNWKSQFGDTIDERERAVFREAAGNELAAQRASAAELATQQKAARDAVAQQKALRRAAGSGAMYANINAGLSALAPETNPMDPSETGFGARNRQMQLAKLETAYGPMLQKQRDAMNQQSAALGQPATDQFEQMVQDQYARIGRTGFGDQTSQIDVPGFMGFVNELREGRMRPKDLTSRFDIAVHEYMRDNPDDRYTKYVQEFRQRQQPYNNSSMYNRVLAPPVTVQPEQERPITTMPVTTPPPGDFQHFGIDEYGRKAGKGFGTAPPPGMQPIYQPTPLTTAPVTTAPVTTAPVTQTGGRPDPGPGAFYHYVPPTAGATDYSALTPAQIANTPSMGVGGFGLTALPGLTALDTPSMGVGGFGLTAAPGLTAYMNQGGIAGLAQGGYPRRNGQISGPGTEKSDSIPAMLSDGEFVMTAKAVRGAGKGSRRAGAKQMYKLMHQLEKNAERG